MELILRQDVEHLGFKDDVVTVKNGYGRNFLIPRGMATMATPSAKKVLEENLRQRAHKEKKVVDAANKTAEGLAKLDVKIPAKVGAGDKLFGSVTASDLVDVLAKEGHEIDKKFISIKGGAIKRAGPYTADIRLHREVNVQFDFEVVAEQK
ncbi:large subunit ribosomal protein L9 [Flavobacteriaceae bacterium MAR_2009_75]|uniref:50S ribosomal protein L9 n=1 Tax=Pseudozobellia sp. WGM2 TaxID=2787625 RepID=UPI000C2C8B38|nr:50S ribosomal protein L9 [Pseudozobellia sp. WGM2]PKA96653.1 large subunit ribosomal protein L9 [Flavobacteriaceae bacterium MAR_2009_75]